MTEQLQEVPSTLSRGRRWPTGRMRGLSLLSLLVCLILATFASGQQPQSQLGSFDEPALPVIKPLDIEILIQSQPVYRIKAQEWGRAFQQLGHSPRFREPRGGEVSLVENIDRGGGVSGRPRFEESARYQAQWAGAPSSVWAPSGNTPSDDRTNDVGTRSRFAAWAHEPGEDAVYIAWHTNAFNASAVGTNTYVYGPNPPDGTLNFTGIDGGMQLANAVHGELVNDIKQDAGWNKPTWTDRGVDSAYFGELSPSNNGETPSILVEVAFHDAAADATQLKEPGFRYLAARAISQGLIKYFAQKDGVPVRLPPEPPTHAAAVNQGNGEAVIRWRAPPTDTQNVRGQAATGYRLYSSDDGLA